MATIKLQPGELPFRLKKQAEAMKKVMKTANRKAAEKSRQILARETPVDLGQAQRSWQVINEGDGNYSVHNDCPYIDVLDKGARPHPVSLEGQELILQWVYRRIGAADEKEAKSITWAIITKIKNEGVEGKHFIEATEAERYEALEKALQDAIAEFDRSR